MKMMTPFGFGAAALRKGGGAGTTAIGVPRRDKRPGLYGGDGVLNTLVTAVMSQVLPTLLLLSWHARNAFSAAYAPARDPGEEERSFDSPGSVFK